LIFPSKTFESPFDRSLRFQAISDHSARNEASFDNFSQDESSILHIFHNKQLYSTYFLFYVDEDVPNTMYLIFYASNVRRTSSGRFYDDFSPINFFDLFFQKEISIL